MKEIRLQLPLIPNHILFFSLIQKSKKLNPNKTHPLKPPPIKPSPYPPHKQLPRPQLHISQKLRPSLHWTTRSRKLLFQRRSPLLPLPSLKLQQPKPIPQQPRPMPQQPSPQLLQQLRQLLLLSHQTFQPPRPLPTPTVSGLYASKRKTKGITPFLKTLVPYVDLHLQ